MRLIRQDGDVATFSREGSYRATDRNAFARGIAP